MNFKTQIIETDFLIIGGGTAGCYAAIKFSEQSKNRVLIVEKANIKRSGCLAAGVNALNAYITKDKTPQSYVEYASNDAEGIVRKDLLLTMAEGLNNTVQTLEKLGLTILKNKQGDYVTRGARNIKINGENIKPILAEAVAKLKQVTVLNCVNVIDYIVQDNCIYGAYAIDVNQPILYIIKAKAVLCATGGAAGLYQPNHTGFSRHKMWYPPFNTGAGYAMGIRAGAEMTTLEMRFIALRCKNTIAPTGTLAQGIGAKQINALGEVYEQKYGTTTSQRVFGTITENKEKRGPCFLETIGISKEQDEDLLKAYLNMAPSQTLHWVESNLPSNQNVEIDGTEPYIVGGHTASGYWINTKRETTIHGLFAAGDVAGGCPQKYVTGALVEGEIAAQSIANYITESAQKSANVTENATIYKNHIEKFFINNSSYNIDTLEEEMQKIMDQYAGGKTTYYSFSVKSLQKADQLIQHIEQKSRNLHANDLQELVYIFELQERLTLCRFVIAHLSARKETRWHSFAEFKDYPNKDSSWEKYVNSRWENGKIKIIFRPLVMEEATYEHQNSY